MASEELSAETKKAVIERFVAQLSASAMQASQAAAAAADGATHEESKAESSKDTRATEASYLARGQAKRVAQLQRDAHTLRFMAVEDFGGGRPIASSALVELEDEDGHVSVVLLAPVGGGLTDSSCGFTVKVVTPQAPLGAALLGKLEGDDVEIRAGGRTRAMVITRVV